MKCQQCPTLLTSKQISNKARFCSHRCYCIHRKAHGINAQAAVAGVHSSTYRRALKAGRVTILADEIRVYSPRRCAYCERALEVRGHNKLCEPCKAAGWRWCGVGPHVYRVEDGQYRNESYCIPHKNHRAPAGWLRPVELAQKLHWSVKTIRDWLRSGRWLDPADIWRSSPGVQADWRIRNMATYPDPPKRRIKETV
jgi:hypothetical protein